MRKLTLFIVFALLGTGLFAQNQGNTRKEGPSLPYRACSIFTPNAFTPNSDGVNDEFKLGVPESCEVIQFSLQVFDRWGRIVFETKDVYNSWDGNYDGQKVGEGVYLWRFTATLRNLDKQEISEVEKKGTVILIR